MPTVQYVIQFRKQNITKEMLTPKRITELRYWLKGAQAVIKEIPRMIAESEQSADRSIGTDGWFVATSDADVKWVKFSLENRLGEKAHIVIHRQSKLLG
jgi:hypothetical protein